MANGYIIYKMAGSINMCIINNVDNLLEMSRGELDEVLLDKKYNFSIGY